MYSDQYFFIKIQFFFSLYNFRIDLSSWWTHSMWISSVAVKENAKTFFDFQNGQIFVLSGHNIFIMKYVEINILPLNCRFCSKNSVDI